MMLPYVVERKRTDDLASSIKDGRFHEQKHRLEQTGLEPIYLIESYSSGGDFGLAEGALMQGVANTQITNRFIIQETDSLKDTCAYLTHMTRHLSRMYQVSLSFVFLSGYALIPTINLRIQFRNSGEIRL